MDSTGRILRIGRRRGELPGKSPEPAPREDGQRS